MAARYGFDVTDAFDMSSVTAANKPMISPTGDKMPVPRYANEPPSRPDLFDRLFPHDPLSPGAIENPALELWRREGARLLFGMTAELPINAVRFLTGNLPDDELPGFALDLLLAGVLGPVIKGATKGASKLPIEEGSRMARELDTSTFKSLKPGSYDAPNRPPRPISEDYPHGVRTDANGRILFDPEGRNLGAMFIVGRIWDGMEDVPLRSRKQFNRLSRELTGMVPEVVPQAEIKRFVARIEGEMPRTVISLVLSISIRQRVR